ncbi:MAG: hypothetical protein HC916_18860 [Coleofasciculaceae cyanobacterium SM2_1_6]|nr:hypothetical protein [Coleofasciculaceae cyanobacterium SM2_1_6]
MAELAEQELANREDSVLISIAEEFRQLENTSVTRQMLSETLQAAQTIEGPSDQSLALNEIAEAYRLLEDTKTAQQLLRQALEAAETASSSNSLASIAVTYAKLKDWGGALRALRRCQEEEKVSALTEVLTLWAEKQNPVLRELREEEE